MKLRVAAGQFHVTSSLPDNISAISKLIRQAASLRAAIVVFPECGLTGYPGADMKSLSDLSPQRVSEALSELSRLARRFRIYVAVGAAIRSSKGFWTNSLIVFDARGRKICTYSKTALTGVDAKHFACGTQDPVFTVRGVKIGCQICFDIRLAEGYRRLLRKGVHVVLHAYYQAGTSYWRHRRDIITAFQRVRASENGVYVVSSNTTGHKGGRDQWIPTMIVDPKGDIVSRLKPSQVSVAVADIDPDDLKEGVEWGIRREAARQLGLRKFPGRRMFPSPIQLKKLSGAK